MDGVALFDCKTAKKKRNENEKRQFECFQGRFYPWFQFLAHPEVDTIAFSYLIFTKQKTIQHHKRTVPAAGKAEHFVQEVLCYVCGETVIGIDKRQRCEGQGNQCTHKRFDPGKNPLMTQQKQRQKQQQ